MQTGVIGAGAAAVLFFVGVCDKGESTRRLAENITCQESQTSPGSQLLPWQPINVR